MIERIFTGIGKALQKLFDLIKDFIVTVIKGILQFARDVVGWL